MNNITNEQLDGLIKSAVNYSGPLPPDEKFSQIISALRELRDLRAAMLQGAEPVTTAYKLPECWVACSERMPGIGTEIFYFCQDDGLRDCGIVSSSNFSGKGDAELYVHAEGYDLCFGVDITHWMPLPAAPNSGD